MKPDAIWLFDSVCVLCEGAVQYTLRHEKAATISFVSIQSEMGRKLALDYGIDPDDPSSFVFIDEGTAHTKSDGVIALAGHLNGWIGIIRMGRFIPKILRDFAYDIVARNRYKIFGKRDACVVPTPKTRERFVL